MPTDTGGALPPSAPPTSPQSPSLFRRPSIVPRSPHCFPVAYRAQMLTATDGALLTTAGASSEPPRVTASSLARRGSTRGSTSAITANDEVDGSGSSRAPSP